MAPTHERSWSVQTATRLVDNTVSTQPGPTGAGYPLNSHDEQRRDYDFCSDCPVHSGVKQFPEGKQGIKVTWHAPFRAQVPFCLILENYVPGLDVYSVSETDMSLAVPPLHGSAVLSSSTSGTMACTQPLLFIVLTKVIDSVS